MTKDIKSKIESRSLPVVLLTVFVDVLGVGILLPVLPMLIYSLFIPAGFSQNESLIMLGWLTAIYPLMMFFSTPILGQLSDRFGRKKVLALCLLGTAVGYVIFALGILFENIPLLFLGRAIDGITGGNISVARAVIADVSPPEHRARNFGIMGAAFGVGFVAGPYLGARLANPNADFFGLFSTPGWFDAATPFWFAAILAIINMLSVLAVLPETHKYINKALRVAWSKSLDNIRKAAAKPGLRVIFTAEFLFWGGFTFFTTFFQILLIEKLGFSGSNVGDFFAYVGICIAIAQAVIVPIAVKYFKSHTLLKIGLIGNGIALFLQLWPDNTPELLLVAPLIAVFNGLTMANASALVSLSAGKEEQGEVLGIEASVQSLAQAVPAIISGYVATMGVSMPIIVGGFTILAGGIIFTIFYRPSKSVLVQEGKSAALLAAD
ncbi:MAG TPA: MFS transporter [Candidatus Saccharimonadales bacterium]|nr:MFS transporter [Candidatus Saccharimonadales bacterium]